MWYLISVVAIVLIGFFIYASNKRKKQSADIDTRADKQFRTEEDLNTYKKPLEDSHSTTIDRDDAE